MAWEAIGVIVGLFCLWISIVALGLAMLSKLSGLHEQLAALKLQWTQCRHADEAAHEVFADQLEDHEERIGVLEGSEEDWTGDRDGQEDDGPKAA